MPAITSVQSKRKRVIHVTTSHSAPDVRIFERECRSLAATGLYEVYLAAAGTIPTDAGVTLVPLAPSPSSRGRRFASALGKSWALAHVVAADLWHFHDLELLPIAIKLARSGHGVIWDAHEDYSSQFGDLEGKAWVPKPARGIVRAGTQEMLRQVDKRASAIVAATETIASRYSNPKTVVVGNEARLGDFAACEPQFESRRLLFTGSVAQPHLFDEVVDAVCSIPDASLAVAGRDPDPVLWNRAVTKLGPRVRHLGWLDRRGLAQEISNSALGLVTYSDIPAAANNSSNKVFEFLAAGLPILASPTMANRRLVGEGAGGFVADAFTAEGLAAAMASALADESRWSEVSRRGREFAAHSGSWTVSEAKLLALYAELLGGE